MEVSRDTQKCPKNVEKCVEGTFFGHFWVHLTVSRGTQIVVGGVFLPWKVNRRASSVTPVTSKWQANSALLRMQLKMPAKAQPWTSREGVHCRGVHTPRAKDLLDLCFVAAKKANPRLTDAEVVQRLWANVGMSSERFPYSLDVVPCFAGSCVPYSFSLDATLSGANQMRLLGWSSKQLPFEFFF